MRRLIGATAKATTPSATVITFVCTQVRQALQHVVASGACSPYFAAAWPSFIVANCFTPGF
jgi:hypothetical protein